MSYRVSVSRSDGKFVARVHGLVGAHTYGSTEAEVVERVREAIEVVTGEEAGSFSVEFDPDAFRDLPFRVGLRFPDGSRVAQTVWAYDADEAVEKVRSGQWAYGNVSSLSVARGAYRAKYGRSFKG